MNLLGVANGAIVAVNPNETVTVARSTGYTENPDGSTNPTSSPTSYSANVQPLSSRDLRQTASLNIQGTLAKFYFYGEVDPIVRQVNKGGDLVTRADGTVWKTTMVFEQWAKDWCSICCVLQAGIAT